MPQGTVTGSDRAMELSAPSPAVASPAVSQLMWPYQLWPVWLNWVRETLSRNRMPLSGDVQQWIEAWGEAVQIGLFNFNITGSRDPQMEKEISGAYSYGSQLGRMLDVLAPLVLNNKELAVAEPDAVSDFRAMFHDIEVIRDRRPEGHHLRSPAEQGAIRSRSRSASSAA